MVTLAGAHVDTADAAAGATTAPEDGLGFAQVVAGITAIIAPATLVTSIAFYFGWVHTDAWARYFGLDPSVLSLSTRDYVVSSLHPLFLPSLTVLLVLIAFGLVHSLTRSLDADLRAGEIRVVSHVAAAVGGVLLVVGALAAFGTIPTHYLFATLAPAGGVVLLTYAVSLRRRLRSANLPPSTVVLVALFSVVSLFWAAGVYAGNVGRSDARALASHLNQLPRAVLYSKFHLGILGAHGVTRAVVTGSEYPVLYSGLRFLVRSDGKYFLLPDGWTHANGAETVVLPESDEWRITLVPGTYVSSGSALKSAFGGQIPGIAATSPAPQYLGPLTISFDATAAKLSVDVYNNTKQRLRQVVAVDGPLSQGAALTARNATCIAAAQTFRCTTRSLAAAGDAIFELRASQGARLSGTIRIRIGRRNATVPVDLRGR